MNAPIRKPYVVADSLINIVTGLGTVKDKVTGNQYLFNPLSDEQLNAAYRSDWIARKIVDIPAYDSIREWRSWQADKNAIGLIEVEEKRLDVPRKLKNAMRRSRLYGGGGLIIGLSDDPEKPLEIEKIRQGDLKYIHPVSRHDLNASEINWDVKDPYYGQPKYYLIQPKNATSLIANGVKLHPSRFVRFCGIEHPDPNINSGGWGDSVLQSIDDAIKNVAMSTASGAHLISELKTDVISVPDLMANANDPEYKSRIIERFQIANVSKSLVNALLLDKEEKWERINTDFAHLPDLLKLYMLLACGAADIPSTRMLGQSAIGLNSTGEGDIRNYYDHIASEQKVELSPSISILDEVLVRSSTGTKDVSSIFYIWNSLWQMDEGQKADVAHKKAQTFQIDVNSGLFDPDVLAKGRQNQLIEDGTYPGLELAIEEAALFEIPEYEPEVIEQIEEQKKIAKDAKPRTLYVRRDVINSYDIISWAKEQGFKTTLEPSDFHVTIAFSRQPVDWIKMGCPYPGGNDKGTLTVPPGGPRLVERLGDKGAVCLLFANTELAWRHKDMKDLGASWDHPEYQPHVSISYDAGDIDLEKIVPYRGAIILGPEIFEEIDEDWVKKVTGKDELIPSFLSDRRQRNAYTVKGKHSFTWLPDIPDRNDYQYKAKLVSYPQVVDLREQMSQVEDQQAINSCTAHALTSAMEFLHPGSELSRMFLYYCERDIESGSIKLDDGAFVRSGLRVLKNIGVPPEKLWPYKSDRFDVKPTPYVYEAAAEFKIKEYMRLNTIDDCLSCLAEGFPFTIGFMAYESIESPEVAKSGIIPMPSIGEKALNGHLVLVVGYDRSTDNLIIKNSWGKKWGMNGYGLLPFAYAHDRNLSDDLWTLRS